MSEKKPKDPVRVACGRESARRRWGPARVIRVDDLTIDQKRLVTALLDAARAANSAERAAVATEQNAEVEA